MYRTAHLLHITRRYIIGMHSSLYATLDTTPHEYGGPVVVDLASGSVACAPSLRALLRLPVVRAAAADLDAALPRRPADRVAIQAAFVQLVAAVILADAGGDGAETALSGGSDRAERASSPGDADGCAPRLKNRGVPRGGRSQC